MPPLPPLAVPSSTPPSSRAAQAPSSASTTPRRPVVRTAGVRRILVSSPIVEPSSEMEVETDGQGRPETSEELRVRLTDEMSEELAKLTEDLGEKIDNVCELVKVMRAGGVAREVAKGAFVDAIKRIGKEVMTAQLSLSLMATDEGRREGAVASSTGVAVKRKPESKINHQENKKKTKK